MGRARLMTTPIHHTSGYYTLSSLYLPPLEVQKGERDTQECIPAGSQVAAVFARPFLTSPLKRVSLLEKTGLLRLAAQWYPSRGTPSSGRSVPPVCGVSAMVPYTVRLRPNYLHNLALLATLLRLQVVPRQRVHNVDTLS
ncbi:hypothetical protein T03_16850, partial [Trichinella britovi]